ncbi:MAG: OprO/OprP family phosphate-selective porin [Nitrococcus sp.]|nr:OprO/OprP family phosphate-selective porin [Nitrococcus sp.]
MARTPKPLAHSAALILGVLLLFAFEQPKAASLEDTLLKKGILTEEEWREIKAEKRKVPVEEKKNEREGEEEFPVVVDYERPGFSIYTRDGNWKTTIKFRFQFRASYPMEGDPVTPSDFRAPEETTFNVRRARLKISGYGYRPWIKYKIEYDWPTNRLLDYRVTLARFDWLQLRLGQWKLEYNRERIESSGAYQFVDRSIVSRVFTIDRQTGVELRGHLFPGTFADSRYYVGAFTGMGRGRIDNDDDQLMYMARLQWNFLGRDVGFSQGDVEYHEEPAGSIAFAAVTNESQCTRFSSSGCGNLEGFPAPDDAEPGQFRINQAMGELAFKYRGLSLEGEYHRKEIKDHVNDTKTDLAGAYAQAGYFFHYLLPVIPKPLEVAARYAFVDPNTSVPDDRRKEYTAALSWYFAGHNNKLTLDASHLTLAQPGSDLADNRVRLQWDITF